MIRHGLKAKSAAIGAAMLAVAAIAAPAIPPTPAPINAIVSAQPFTLEQGFRSDWSKDRPIVTAGYLLVLDVQRDFVYPRQSAQPILLGDRTTIERLNVGYESGRVIAILPSQLDEHGTMKLDLSKSPLWFGAPGLPEQVTADKIASERAAADAAGIRPATARQVGDALAAGGRPLAARDKSALLRHAAALIVRHAPDEKELAEALAAEPAP